jgi:hypothetical protein
VHVECGNGGYRFDDHSRWAFLGQDDTTEMIIIRKIFGKETQIWAEPRMVEYCFNCLGSQFLLADFSHLAPCPNNVPTYSMNSLVSYHPAHSDERLVAGWLIGKYPPDVHIYQRRNSMYSTVCKREDWREYREMDRLYVAHIRADILR